MDKFHKEGEISSIEVNPSSIFIPVDSPDWRKPKILSIEKLGNILQIKIDTDFALSLKSNISAIKFTEQDLVPSVTPDSCPVDEKTHLCVDNNYLYVWVPQANRWKRIPLSSW